MKPGMVNVYEIDDQASDVPPTLIQEVGAAAHLGSNPFVLIKFQLSIGPISVLIRDIELI